MCRVGVRLGAEQVEGLHCGVENLKSDFPRRVCHMLVGCMCLQEEAALHTRLAMHSCTLPTQARQSPGRDAASAQCVPRARGQSVPGPGSVWFGI